jgi:hypothetical protein
MDDIAQLKRRIDDVVFALNERLADASHRKAKAEKEMESSKREIDVVSRALQDFKPLQGFYGLLSTIQAAAPKAQHGDNRKIVAEILSAHHEPMTNSDIAKIAHAQGKIKSKKGYKGVYATTATVLSRGKNVFVNLNGKWDLRERRIRPSGSATETDPRKGPGLANMMEIFAHNPPRG